DRLATEPAILSLKGDGSFATVTKTMEFTKPAMNDNKSGVKIAGITILPSGMTISLSHTGAGGKPLQFSIDGGASLATFIPNLLTQDDAPLNVITDNLKLNEEGIVSFDAKGPNFVGSFSFAHPMDFAMAPLTKVEA